LRCVAAPTLTAGLGVSGSDRPNSRVLRWINAEMARLPNGYLPDVQVRPLDQAVLFQNSPLPRFDHHGSWVPPSMERMVPVTDSDAGSHRNTTPRAISSGRISLPIGNAAPASRNVDSVKNFRSPGVSVQPG